jgi:hypothetical protein
MDRATLKMVGRLGMAGVLCAGALIGSACGRDAATGANAVVGPSVLAAEGEGGLTPAELMERGWSCRVTPVGTTACSPPGRGLPVFGAPEDRPPSYLVHVFDTATSEYLGFSRMIRTDLYQGQTCPSAGTAYTHLPHIGYYECFNPVS